MYFPTNFTFSGDNVTGINIPDDKVKDVSAAIVGILISSGFTFLQSLAILEHTKTAVASLILQGNSSREG
jgi:hypothetical protein